MRSSHWSEMNGNTYQVWLPSPYRLAPRGRNWLRGLGWARSWNKFVPEAVFGLEDQSTLFLRHLWATDGSITISRNGHGPIVRTYYSSTSRRLVLDVKRMLLRFGVRSAQGETARCTPLRIQGAEDQTRFLSIVGCHGARWGEDPHIPGDPKANPNVDLVPWEYFGR